MAVAYGGLLYGVNFVGTPHTSTSVTLPSGAYAIATWFGTASITAGPITISDSAGGTWVAIQTGTVGSALQPAYGTWIRSTVGTGTSFTVSVSMGTTTRSNALTISYWTGTNGTVSSVTTGTGTTAYPSVVTPTSNGVGDMFIAVGTAGGSTATNNATASTGFTLITSVAGSTTTFTSNNLEYQISTGSGETKTASFTKTGTGTISATRVSTFVLRASSYPNTPFVGWGMRL
jgi:hypothetical protein